MPDAKPRVSIQPIHALRFLLISILLLLLPTGANAAIVGPWTFTGPGSTSVDVVGNQQQD